MGSVLSRGNSDGRGWESLPAAGGSTDYAVGIDLGTTNSCVAVWDRGVVEIIANDNGNLTTPSCVAITEDGGYLVGECAKDQATTNPKRTFVHIKRLLDRRLADVQRQTDSCLWPYSLVEEEGRCVIEVEVENRKTKYAPEDLLALILMKMKETAEARLDTVVDKAVITVPANFSQAQKVATKIAARLAGLEIVRLLTEPAAAALAYACKSSIQMDYTTGGRGGGGGGRGGEGGGGLRGSFRCCTDGGGSYGFGGSSSSRRRRRGRHFQSDGIGPPRVLFVVDWGGGTFDVSVMTVRRETYTVIGQDGDTQLGGKDIDDVMVQHFVDDFYTKHGIKLHQYPRPMRRLRTECEKMKHALSSCKYVRIVIDGLCEGKDFEMKMTRDKLQELAAPFFDRCMHLVARALADAGVERASIWKVVLAGGTMRMPGIQDKMEEYFGEGKLSRAINPDHCVAIGATWQAALDMGLADVDCIGDLAVVESVPLSIGVKNAGGVFVKCIRRNTPYPVMKKQSDWRTGFDGATSATMVVYEGERLNAEENQQLGEVTLYGLEPKDKDGRVRLEASLEIDEDGILTAMLTDLSSDGGDRKKAWKSFGRNWGRCTRQEAHVAASEATTLKETDKISLERSRARWQLKEAIRQIQWKIRDTKDTDEEARMRKIVLEAQQWWEENRDRDLGADEYRNKRQEVETKYRLRIVHAEAQRRRASIRQRRHTSNDLSSDDDDKGYEGSNESNDDIINMDFNRGVDDATVGAVGGEDGHRDSTAAGLQGQRCSTRLREETDHGAGGAGRGGGGGRSGGQTPLSPRRGRFEVVRSHSSSARDEANTIGSLTDFLGLSMGPPSTPHDDGEAPGCLEQFVDEAARGMEGTPGGAMRHTGDDVDCPPIHEIDVETDVDRKDKEERQRALVLAQSYPVTQDIRATLDVACALETGVALVGAADCRDTDGTRERIQDSEEVDEGDDPQTVQGDGRVCRPGLDPIRDEDDDAEGGGDGGVGGGDAPHGGSDTVARHDACEEDRRTTAGGHQADAGGSGSSVCVAHTQRSADEGHGEQATFSAMVGRPNAVVVGVCVSPSGGGMPTTILE
ncbi:hypothetical protein CBR_g28685 [Chara braunii]|uniref:Uncharacterized protein n=1 Tax=Chara braunii TaxID=69332 RepID=A0A388L9J0_CHABU|nr:hypothetical protein CBR_g28685 [Chara braunii]|eukprot:GBG78971.1 hypothetical protein CBR_g28685 [Chara braunii]